MQNIGQQLGYSALEVFRPHPALVSADAIGVELELEGFTNSDIDTARRHLNPHWTITSDGSLRNGGVEFITTGGKGGETLHQAFERITTLLEQHVNYDASWRCSTHMHLNMLDFTCNQVARYMLVYAACEPVLFALAGPQRRSSNFCTPLGDSLTFHKRLIGRLYDDSVASRLASQFTNKYTALNFQPLFGNQNVRPLGTIEFRGGRPMTTMRELLLQTNILLSMKEFVRSFPGTEDEMLVKLGEGVFNTVFQNGCAASLDSVRVEDLEVSLIHAWMLLKSYQEGMKNRAEEPVRANGNSFGQWDNDLTAILAQRTRPTPRPVGDDPVAPPEAGGPFWSASTPTREMRFDGTSYSFEELGYENWPSLASNIGALQDPLVSVRRKAELMVQVLNDPAFRYRLPRGTATLTAMNWILTVGGSSRETTPIGTIMRAVENQRRSLSMRRVECFDTSERYGAQPAVVGSSFNINYMPTIAGSLRARIADYMQLPNALLNNRCVWQYFLTTRVALQNRDQLQQALTDRTGMPHRQLPESMTAAQAYYLFRICNVSSVDHIVPQYLPYYDRIVAMISVMVGMGLSFPVAWKNRSMGGDRWVTKLYICSSRNHVLGYAADPQLVADHQTHPSRASQTTGQRLY